MKHNQGHKITDEKYLGDDPGWDFFDSLPRLQKEMTWYFPVKMAWKSRSYDPAATGRSIAKLREEVARDTLRVYGSDHPEAAR